MADISTALIEYLKTKSSITTLVGSGTAARIYKDTIKQGVKPPFIRMEIFEGTSEEHLSGISGVGSNRVQIDAYGISTSEAHSLAELIRLAPLQMYRGTVGTVEVLGCTSPNGYSTGKDKPPKGSQQHRYFCSRDYFLTYQEATS